MQTTQESFFKSLRLFFLALALTVAACSSPKTDDKKDQPTPPGPQDTQPAQPQFVQAKLDILRYNESARNSVAAQKAPYVVLVSFDGFRFDYEKLHGASTLQSIAQNGVRAEGLIPVFPSKTFPNHYSVVTGLYSDQHGLVSNEFLDPKTEEAYSIGTPTVPEGKWYGGEPLWNTAQKNGFLSASLFWVGSEAAIQGMHPNWYAKFNDAVTSDDRIQKVMEWLQLPEDQRPHFITLYFSEVDTAGHAGGPESNEVKLAVTKLDGILSQLRTKLAETHLPVNLIVVSDHGMEKLDKTKTVLIDPSIDLSAYNVSGQGTMIKLYLKRGFKKSKIDETVAALRAQAQQNSHYRVWKREEMKKFHFSRSARVGDIIIEPDIPYLVYVKAPTSEVRGGNHGWDPQRFPQMHGIFYAEGPAFKRGTTLPAFENVNVFPMISHILGFKVMPQTSGHLKVTQAALVR